MLGEFIGSILAFRNQYMPLWLSLIKFCLLRCLMSDHKSFIVQEPLTIESLDQRDILLVFFAALPEPCLENQVSCVILNNIYLRTI